MPSRHRQPREKHYAFPVRCAWAVLSLLAFLPARAASQRVFGELLDNEAGQPIVTAQVVLTDASGNVVGRALSDATGHFFIEVPPGTYSVVIGRLGYDPVHVTDIQVTNSSVAPYLRIELSPAAVELPGLVVEGERRESYLTDNGFYDRQRMGFGSFAEITDLQRLQTIVVSDLLRRFPSLVINDEGEVFSRRGAWIGGSMSACHLQVLVDRVYRGIYMDEVLTLKEVEAIEVYHGISNIPAEWQSLALRGGRTRPPYNKLVRTCGLVVVWTRH